MGCGGTATALPRALHLRVPDTHEGGPGPGRPTQHAGPPLHGDVQRCEDDGDGAGGGVELFGEGAQVAVREGLPEGVRLMEGLPSDDEVGAATLVLLGGAPPEGGGGRRGAGARRSRGSG